jgi:hypothetical protein
VNGEVEEHTAGPAHEVDRRPPGIAVDDAEAVEPADLAGPHRLRKSADAGIEATVEPHLEQDPARLGRGDRLGDGARLEGDRLFAEDLLARLGGTPDHLDVPPRRSGDHHRFDLGIAQQLVGVGGRDGNA